MATSLRDKIRAMTAVGSSVVSNQLVDDALADNRVRHAMLPVEFEPSLSNTGTVQYLAGNIHAWGSVEPVTQSTAAAAGQQLQRQNGAAVATWTIDADGQITYTSDQASSGTHYWTGYSFDLSAAAADVLEQVLAGALPEYAFQDGDQRFDPGSTREALTAQVSAFRARSLARVSMMVRCDDVPTMRRRAYRSRGGNDR